MILAFLSMAYWDDGAPRKLGRISLFVELGRWKAVVADSEGHRVAFVVADTPDELLAVIDTGLERDSLDWRPEKVWPGKGR